MRLLILLLCVSCSAANTQTAPTWTMVNCNALWHQADCHVLTDQDEIALVDAGTAQIATDLLIPYLRKEKINRIHHFFISHPHTDHYGGLEPLLDQGFKIDTIYYNDPPRGISDSDYVESHYLALLARARNSGITLINLSKGDIIELPSSTITILEAQKQLTRRGNKRSFPNIYLEGWRIHEPFYRRPKRSAWSKPHWRQ